MAAGGLARACQERGNVQYGPVLLRMCGRSAMTGVPARWLGVSHFRPVGAPAVNMGVQSGRGHSLCGAAAASRSPLACNGPGARGYSPTCCGPLLGIV